MEAVGSRLGRASSRYGAPAVFSGPVRKWKKKWVHIASSSVHNNNNNNSNSHPQKNNNSNSASSRLILRRWTPITASSAAEDEEEDPRNVSDEPPRRKFRYTPIAVLEEQKKAVTEKAEMEGHQPAIESEQLPTGQTNLTHEIHGKLNMNEISEESKDSNISELNLGLSYTDIDGDNGQNGDDQLEKKYLVEGP